MAKNNDDLYGTTYPTESIKVIAESIGIANLPDEAAKELADEVTFRLKHIIQDAAKFMHHAHRSKLTQEDIDMTLKQKNIEVYNCKINKSVFLTYFILASIRISFARLVTI